MHTLHEGIKADKAVGSVDPGCHSMAPRMYLQVFVEMNVSAVVQLNSPEYCTRLILCSCAPPCFGNVKPSGTASAVSCPICRSQDSVLPS